MDLRSIDPLRKLFFSLRGKWLDPSDPTTIRFVLVEKGFHEWNPFPTSIV